MADRDILFRGKRLDNGEWVEGYLLADDDLLPGAYICPKMTITCRKSGEMLMGGFICVDPSTVCQYTGLTDKNGVRIFEGDVVKWGHIPGYNEDPVRVAQVKISPDIQFDAKIGDGRYVFHYGAFYYADCTDKALEVIGNRWDNPELLPPPPGEEDAK